MKKNKRMKETIFFATFSSDTSTQSSNVVKTKELNTKNLYGSTKEKRNYNCFRF